MQSGFFGPDLLRALNHLTRRMVADEQDRAGLLAAYADGAGLPAGSFSWDDQTGAWTHTETPVPSLPPEAGAPDGAEGPSQQDPGRV